MKVLCPVLAMKILCPRSPISFRQTGTGIVGHPSFTHFAFNDPMKNHCFSFTKRKSKLTRGKILVTSCTAMISQDWNPSLCAFLYTISPPKVITPLPLCKGSAHRCLLSCSSVLDARMVRILS